MARFSLIFLAAHLTISSRFSTPEGDWSSLARKSDAEGAGDCLATIFFFECDERCCHVEEKRAA